MEQRAKGDLPPLCGVFGFGCARALGTFAGDGVPCVAFKDDLLPPTNADCVQFDNVDGGRQATNHLLALGHECIAFLALHAEKGASDGLHWSLLREMGWRKAMEKAAKPTYGLAFHPARTSSPEHTRQVRAGREAAEALLERVDITAIVATNHLAARGLLQGLDESGRPAAQWPAILCFDEEVADNASVMSYLRLSWEEIGRTAAALLHERYAGRLNGPFQSRLVPMKLIPRLTCRPEWAQETRVAQQHVGRSLVAVPA